MKILLSSANCIDIFGLCETFRNKNVDDEVLSMPGYTFERKDRCETNSTANKGGGILIYLNNHLNYIRRNDLESQEIESVWMEIALRNNKPFLICSVYRPPSSHAEWCELFSKQIERASSHSEEIYILGDINIDIKDGNISNTTWKHVVELHDLQQLITDSTRVTAHSNTLVDHLYVSNQGKIAEAFVPNVAISDHYPICFTRSTSKKSYQRNNHTTMQYRCYKKLNEEVFQLELSESLSSVEISGNDSALNFEAWTTTFMKVYNKYAPIKTKRVKHETQPEWINDEIKTAIKTRDTYHKLKDWKQYKFWRNKTAALIRTSKRGFFAKSIAGDKATSFLWKHLRNISGKNNERRIPQEIITDKESINEKPDIIENLISSFLKSAKSYRVNIHKTIFLMILASFRLT